MCISASPSGFVPSGKMDTSGVPPQEARALSCKSDSIQVLTKGSSTVPAGLHVRSVSWSSTYRHDLDRQGEAFEARQLTLIPSSCGRLVGRALLHLHATPSDLSFPFALRLCGSVNPGDLHRHAQLCDIDKLLSCTGASPCLELLRGCLEDVREDTNSRAS